MLPTLNDQIPPETVDHRYAKLQSVRYPNCSLGAKPSCRHYIARLIMIINPTPKSMGATLERTGLDVGTGTVAEDKREHADRLFLSRNSVY